MINTDKLLKKFQKALDEAWDAGYENGYSDGKIDGQSEGYVEGVQAHKDHIQARLKFSEELSLSAGKGAEAVRMREMAEFLAWEYDPEEAERQMRFEEEHGF